MKNRLPQIVAAAIGVVVVVGIVVAVAILGPSGGNVAHVERSATASELYSSREIDAAMDVVERHFARHFAGCTLTELVYDEELSLRSADEWAERYGASRALVLTSTFTVDESGASPSLEPGGTYTRWQWILTQGGIGGWKLQDWGY